MAIGWKKDYFRYKDFFLNIATLYKVKPNLKKYLELIFSMFTIGLFAVFAIKPTVITIIDLQKQIKEREETVISLNQKVRDLQTANTVLQSERNRLPIILQSVPDRANPETLVRQIEALALQNSLTMTSFSLTDAVLIGTSKKPDTSDELPFTVTVTGSYQNLLSFTKSMQNLRRPVQIDSFAINSSLKENEKVLGLIISGRVPYLLETALVENEVQ